MSLRPRMKAGGRATEAGMAFQAEVGTWLAAHLLARMGETEEMRRYVSRCLAEAPEDAWLRDALGPLVPQAA